MICDCRIIPTICTSETEAIGRLAVGDFSFFTKIFKMPTLEQVYDGLRFITKVSFVERTKPAYFTIGSWKNYRTRL